MAEERDINLADWLVRQPEEVGGLISARTSLRYIPNFLNIFEAVHLRKDKSSGKILLGVFRLISEAWANLAINKIDVEFTIPWKYLNELKFVTASLGTRSTLSSDLKIKDALIMERKILDLAAISVEIRSHHNYRYHLDLLIGHLGDRNIQSEIYDAAISDIIALEAGNNVSDIAQSQLWNPKIPSIF